MGSMLSKQTRKSSGQESVIESDSEYKTDEGDEFEEINLSSQGQQFEEYVEVFSNSEDNFEVLGMATNNMRINTDAIESRKSGCMLNYPNPLNITVEQVEYLENKLEFYEKVSLVFLLCDNVDVALQHLIVEEGHETQNILRNGNKTSLKIISNWARSKHNDIWQNKLLEALCIIQNYAILKELGYDKEDMKIRFLPTNPYTSLFIDLTKKVLYIICENIIEEKRAFLKYIREDFKEKKITFQEYDDNYLELYFLKLFSERYIKQDDMSNLKKIFKQLDLQQFCDWLNSVENLKKISNVDLKGTKSRSHRDNVPNNLNIVLNGAVDNENLENKNDFSNESSILSNASFLNNKLLYKSGDCYKMDPEKPGICLIINQKHFYQDKNKNSEIIRQLSLHGDQLKTRHGTDVDRDRLESTFKKFNFKVVIKDNCTDKEIIENIENTMKMFSKRDCCLIVCILSHGLQASVFGVNSLLVEISEIEDLVQSQNYPNLLGKPKIIILQSCQGIPLQEVVACHEDDFVTTDSPNTSICKQIKNVGKNRSTEQYIVTDAPVIIPEKSDLLTCYSTVLGYASIRNEIQGSWYIQELCEILLKEAPQKHLLDILSIVTGTVSKKEWRNPRTNKKMCMVPEIKSSFRKFLYFPTPVNCDN